MARRLALLVPVLALAASSLSAQESDYIDMRSPGSRAIIFETANTNGIDRLSEVSLLGDVNGDGIGELSFVLTGRASGEPPLVYVIPGGGEWDARNTIGPELPGVSRFRSGGFPGSRIVIGDTGDLNGDGLADLVFSDTSYVLPEHAEDFAGVVFIVYGEAGFQRTATFGELRDGIFPATLIYNSSDPSGANRLGARGGMALADVNGNGTPDLVLGGHTVGADDVEADDGVISVLLDPGDPGPRVDLADLGDSVPGFSLRVSQQPAEIERVGDFDGDGFEDIVVSGRGIAGGWIVVFYGRADPRGVYDLAALGPEGGDFLVLHPPAKQDAEHLRYGGAGQVSGVGDLNGDGFDELLVGESYSGANSPTDPLIPPAHGTAHLVYGGPRLVTTIALDQISSERRKVIHGEELELFRDRFGEELADAGDINGDGVTDLLFGAREHVSLWGNDGEAYLVYGQAEISDDVYLEETFHGIRLSGGYPNGRLGLEVGPAGDFNADGNADFFVLEPQTSSQSEEPARIYIVVGTGDGVPPFALLGIEPPFGPQRGSLAEIAGSGFRGEVEVYLGTRRVLVHEASATRLRIEAPPSEELGLVDVRVVVDGVELTLPGGYEYVPDFPQFDLNDLGDDGLVADPSGVLATPGIALGDLTGDGIADLAVAGWLGDTWEVMIVVGGPGLPEQLGPGDERARVLVADSPGSPRVEHLALVGDVNGDGFEDLAISLDEAEAYLLFGRSELANAMTIEEEIGSGGAVEVSVLGGPGRNQYLEFAPLDDVDGDGITDLAIGIPGDFAGEVVVVPGRREWPELVDLSDPTSITIVARLDGLPGATRLGKGLVAAGDLDGDGTGDLLSSADPLDQADTSPAFLIPVVPPLILVPEAVVRIEVEHRPGTGGSISVAPAGDTDGDGRAEFVLGYERGGFQAQGVTFLVRRETPTGTLLRIPVDPAEPDGIVRVFGQPNTQSSQPTGIGDFNGDGYDDIAIRAWSWPINPTTIRGVGAVVFCRPDMPARIELGELRANGLRFEADPVSAFLMGTPNTGDLNGDGHPDFAVRKRQNVPSTGDTVYVIYSPYREAAFTRGDANRDGRIDISDGTYILTFLFLGGARPPCEDAADADDLGAIELTDGVYLLNHLFLGGPPPPAPYPGEGTDATADALGCVGF